MTTDTLDPWEALKLSDEDAELALAEAVDDLSRGLTTTRRDALGGRTVRLHNGTTVVTADWRSWQ